MMQNQINIRYGSSEIKALAAEIESKHYSCVFILVDSNTEAQCLTRFLELCPVVPTAVLKMKEGEAYKNLETCQTLWEQLSEEGADRNSVLINLGGGVVTDLGGFVACAFKRGIAFYNIPTTLLAMVDASVGGKTGIDLGALKNQIGIIREPQAVIIDASWLETLPQNELRSGFAEMLKHGLIAHPAYWEELKNITTLTPSTLDQYIEPSVAEKEKVVREDPNERGLRKILNFGHTLGHAIESYFLITPSKTRLLHGEAIAIGMVLEAYLSTVCTGLSKESAREIKSTFGTFFPKVALSNEDQKAILALLRHDKKNREGRINFVLLEEIGTPLIDREVPQSLFDEAFAFYLEN
jgi:3-dehydroquinate synthase